MSGLKYSEVIKFLDSEIRSDEKEVAKLREMLDSMSENNPDRKAIYEWWSIRTCELIHDRGIKTRFEIMFGEYNDEEYADE